MCAAMVVRVGTSGWSYDHWVGVLYQPGLTAAKRLSVYAAEFDTVELNASFYRWPSEVTFARWRDQLPAGFAMTVKAARGLTHARRLRSPEEWVRRIEHGWLELGEKRAAVLFQLHPGLQRDDARLEHFLGALPDGLPAAVEFRHPSWDDPAVYQMLERHGTSYVVMSGAGLPCVLKATAELVYVRMHGPDQDRLYAGSYSDDELRWWADRVCEWHDQGRNVLMYFNNDGAGNAVRNARTILEMLSAATVL